MIQESFCSTAKKVEASICVKMFIFSTDCDSVLSSLIARGLRDHDVIVRNVFLQTQTFLYHQKDKLILINFKEGP